MRETGEKEGKSAREKESYIQNSRDKAELSDLAVTVARAYGRSRDSTSRRQDQERWGTGCNMQI